MRIFTRTVLRPTQLRSVADRRFDDAQALRTTQLNARANGAIYLGGFVIECLLKAMLVDKFRWLQSSSYPAKRSEDDKRIWWLCHRSHDLEAILSYLPEVREKLSRSEQRGAPRLSQSLKSVCEWTIFARYSPATADVDDPDSFLRYSKVLQLMKDMREQGARIVALATEGDSEVPRYCDSCLFVPASNDLLSTILEVVPLQLLAYTLAITREIDVDRPRNLVKAVVEE